MNRANRIVKLRLDGEDMIEIAECIGTWDKLWMAIGYLSSWNPTYPEVAIIRDSTNEPDLIAIYTKEDGSRGYVIGAVWNGTDYGFHS